MASPLSSKLSRLPVRLVALSLLAASPAFANWLSKDKPIPDWGLEAAKTQNTRLRQGCRRRHPLR